MLTPTDASPSPSARTTGHGPRTTLWTYFDRVDYAAGLKLQEQARDRVRSGGDESLLLLEHPPVYTLGRSATDADITASREWLESRGVEVFETDRGGQVTYHGPGQLVGYPILDLSEERDLRRYIHNLQQVLVDTLAAYDIGAHARHEQAEIGVWVEERKIASLGVHISRWITTHGFALNVATDLSYFDGIVPCGLPAVRMTSIEKETGAAPSLESVSEVLVGCFGSVMGRRMVAESVSASD